MAPGVIADCVPGLGDGPGERGFLPSEIPYEKERGFHAVPGENIEQTRGAGGVGAVVEGERQLAGEARRNERAAKNLRSGPAGGIEEATHSKAEGRRGSDSESDSDSNGG